MECVVGKEEFARAPQEPLLPARVFKASDPDKEGVVKRVVKPNIFPVNERESAVLFLQNVGRIQFMVGKDAGSIIKCVLKFFKGAGNAAGEGAFFCLGKRLLPRDALFVITQGVNAQLLAQSVGKGVCLRMEGGEEGKDFFSPFSSEKRSGEKEVAFSSLESFSMFVPAHHPCVSRGA